MHDNNDKPLFISSFNIKKSTPKENRNQRNIIKTKKTTGSINGKSNLNDYSTKNDSLKKNVENIFPAKSELLDTNDTLNTSKLEYSEYKMVKKIARQIIKKNHSHNKKTKIAKNIIDGSANKNNHINLNIVKQKCEKCFKIFKDQDGLQKHINFAHSEEKPHKCILCNSSFKNEFSLKAHKKIHFGENLYECEFCLKKFVHKSKLTIHLRIHNNERPFECGICDKKFKTNGNLTYHTQLHTEERSYECETCGVLFRQSLHLTNHIRIHTGEKPFTCDICKMAFNQSHVLVTHKLRAHKVNIF